jgi:hypothetical protein
LRRVGIDGQRELERRPAAFGALNPNVATVRLDDALGDGKPEARARARCTLRLPKAVEDVRNVFRGYPDACICDGNDDLVSSDRR